MDDAIDRGAGPAQAPVAREIARQGGSMGVGQDGGQVTLDFAGRYRRRARLVTDTGEAVLLDLAEATELRDGDVLVLEDGRQIRIAAAPEPLLAVSAADPRHLTRLAWHIGNRHTPCEVQAGRLLIQRDHVLAEMIRGLGGTVEEVEAPFQPEGGAYGHGRTHGHSHSHDPQADPDAALRRHLHSHTHEAPG
ncbi:MAG: urease accessory protein UreE [Pseudomonadota bacterium]